MSFSLPSQQHRSTQMQTDYTAAQQNGTTLDHCLEKQRGMKCLKYELENISLM